MAYAIFMALNNNKHNDCYWIIFELWKASCVFRLSAELQWAVKEERCAVFSRLLQQLLQVIALNVMVVNFNWSNLFYFFQTYLFFFEWSLISELILLRTDYIQCAVVQRVSCSSSYILLSLLSIIITIYLIFVSLSSLNLPSPWLICTRVDLTNRKRWNFSDEKSECVTFGEMKNCRKTRVIKKFFIKLNSFGLLQPFGALCWNQFYCQRDCDGSLYNWQASPKGTIQVLFCGSFTRLDSSWVEIY